MGSLLDIGDLRQGARLLLDSSPIIYVLERHPHFAPRFRPLFEAHGEGRVTLTVTTVTIAEVLVGPMRAGDEPLELQYRKVLETWRQIPLDFAIAESAARLRASLGLKLADAIQAASAIAAGADALVTHDRDFSRLKGLKVIS